MLASSHSLSVTPAAIAGVKLTHYLPSQCSHVDRDVLFTQPRLRSTVPSRAYAAHIRYFFGVIIGKSAFLARFSPVP